MMKTGDSSIQLAVRQLDPEVLDMLRSDLPAQHAAARDALARNDWREARDNVHTINGSASFCRIEALRSVAQLLEQELNSPPPSSGAIERFHAVVDDVLTVLQMENTDPQHGS